MASDSIDFAAEPSPGPLRPSPCDALHRRRRTLWVSILEGSFTVFFLTWTTGAVLTGYLLALGAGPRVLAAAASMPLLVQLASPLMTALSGHVRRRTSYLQWVTSLGRGLWIIAVFAPLFGPLGWPPALVMVGLVAVSGLLQSGVGPAWISLMADVVPEEIRGRYFGFRNGIMAVIAMIASLSAGWYLDHAPAPGSFQFVFAIGLLFAAVGIVMYGWHEDPERTAPRLALGETIRVPLRDPNFRRFLWFSMYWQAAVMLASPFVIPYFLTHLKMSFTQVAIWGAIAAICTLGAAPLWGRLADQVGHKAVLMVTSILVGVALPICWIAAVPGFLLFIWIGGVMDAIAWGGVNTSLFNLSLVAAPPKQRMAYFAVLGAASGLTGCIAGLLSGPLLEGLMPYTFEVRGYQWTAYHSLFVISGILRTVAHRLLRSIPEPPARPLRAVLREYAQRGASLVLQSRTGAS